MMGFNFAFTNAPSFHFTCAAYPAPAVRKERDNQFF
jgi:hypothetical protein